MVKSDINIIFWFFLGMAAVGATVIAAATVIKVIRLRNVRLSWKTGKLKGYPLFSTLFLMSAFLVAFIALYRNSMEEMMIAGLYGWLGCCWFTASFFSAKRYITDNGIVKNVNEPSQTVAWHEIRDFVEAEKDGGPTCQYIFLYNRDSRYKCDSSLIRLELEVPGRHRKSFQKLISHKLGQRIRCYLNDDINVRHTD